MRRVLVLTFLLISILVSDLSVYAAPHRFEDFAIHGFSIDVPVGWLVSVNEEEICIDSPCGDMSIVFTYAHREVWNPHTLALAIASEHKVNDIAKSEDNEEFDYEFTYTENETEFNIRTLHIQNIGIVMKSKSDFEKIQSIMSTFVLLSA